MLVSPLPTNDRFDRLRACVDTGMACVATPEKVVAMAITRTRVGMEVKTRPDKGTLIRKGKKKNRACFLSLSIFKAACPDPADKQNGIDGKDENVNHGETVHFVRVVVCRRDQRIVPKNLVWKGW
ncbi:LOW QUALITY PROTEIN: hypothetical protein PHMEG_00018264 [Phytophthora megakarya]|uniref:Uncharacterized protein n=1 Tax=Phytophthora megakarya TaxID=4795 RepID=A0A225VU76_9STRA|nr:LOW QUALITY PROTEIN: hypothetical protein PHMEG_00018264 [Phytophthora megakarya]